jgi:septum formation protein
MDIILASSSQYRLNLLRQIHIEPIIIVPDIDEMPLPIENARQTSMRLAKEKCIAANIKYLNTDNKNNKNQKDFIIIASDQVLLLGDKMLGKPMSHVEAVKQLQQTRNKTMVFYTSIYMQYNDKYLHDVVETKVQMRNYSDELIEKYLIIEQPYNCAGSAKSEGLGAILIKSMSSDDPSALIGLPLTKVIEGLEMFGYSLL